MWSGAVYCDAGAQSAACVWACVCYLCVSVCVCVCFHAASAYSLPRAFYCAQWPSLPHTFLFFFLALFQSQGVKPNGMRKRRRRRGCARIVYIQLVLVFVFKYCRLHICVCCLCARICVRKSGVKIRWDLEKSGAVGERLRGYDRRFSCYLGSQWSCCQPLCRKRKIDHRTSIFFSLGALRALQKISSAKLSNSSSL